MFGSLSGSPPEVIARFDELFERRWWIGSVRWRGRRTGPRSHDWPRQGAEVVVLPKMIPIHFDDCGDFASPSVDFTREMRRRGIADRIIELRRRSPVTS